MPTNILKLQQTMRHHISIILFSLLSFGTIAAQTSPSNSQNTQLPQEKLELPKSLDYELEQLLQRWYEGYERRSISPYALAESMPAPKTADSVYINMLDRIPSAIRLTYNPIVRESIELYLYRRRPLLSLMLSLGDLYFPDIEAELDRHKLPLELKYLTIVESALNPSAISPAGAAGLWQFMLPTAKRYGLSVNSLVDERMDPIKGTEAACKMLKELYAIYNDWWLVMAAYNCGPGNVNRAIARSGGNRSFWKIYPYLPRETRRYVPLYIGVYYAMYYAHHYGIKARELDRNLATEYYEVTQTTSFAKLASLTGLSIEQIKAYNPQFRRGIVPWNHTPYQVRLPLRAVMRLEGYSPEELRSKELEVSLESTQDSGLTPRVYALEDDKYIYHIVARRETVESIARRYKVNTKQIRAWNKIGKRGLKQGRRIIVGLKTTVSKPSKEGSQPHNEINTATSLDSLTSTPKAPKHDNRNTHIVAKGETLISLAMHYNINVNKLKQLNQLKKDEVSPGDTLLVTELPTQITTGTVPSNKPNDISSQVKVKQQANTQESRQNKTIQRYKIKKGDTLSKIAKMHGVRIETLRHTNNLKNDHLKIGQIIRIEK